MAASNNSTSALDSQPQASRLPDWGAAIVPFVILALWTSPWWGPLLFQCIMVLVMYCFSWLKLAAIIAFQLVVVTGSSAVSKFVKLVHEPFVRRENSQLRSTAKTKAPTADEIRVAGTKPYTYRPLPSGRYIRIIRLHLGVSSEPLRCELEEVDLDSANESFTAVSYRWDDEQRQIDCEGSMLSIGRNLFELLWALRRERERLSIWADALCINQSCHEEKNMQLPLMKDIYSKSSRCVVWLGWHDTNTPLAFKLLETINTASIAVDSESHPRSGTTSDVELIRLKGKSVEQLEPDTSESPEPSGQSGKQDSHFDLLAPGATWKPRYATNRQQWDALCALLRASWFQRVWTLQEVVLPRYTEIHCGYFRMAASAFYNALHFIGAAGLGNHLKDPGPGYALSLEVSQLRTERHSLSAPIERDLLQILRSARQRVATDPRDKVLGALGLCRKSDVDSLGIGYNNSTAEVYTAVALHVLRRPQDLERLLSAVTYSPSRVDKNLASFVPDWDYQCAVTSTTASFENTTTFCAGGKDAPAFSIKKWPSNQSPLQLVIRSKYVGTLQSLLDGNSEAFRQGYEKSYPKSRSRSQLNHDLGTNEFDLYWQHRTENAHWDRTGDAVKTIPSLQQYFLTECLRMVPGGNEVSHPGRFSWEVLGHNSQALCREHDGANHLWSSQASTATSEEIRLEPRGFLERIEFQHVGPDSARARVRRPSRRNRRRARNSANCFEDNCCLCTDDSMTALTTPDFVHEPGIEPRFRKAIEGSECLNRHPDAEMLEHYTLLANYFRKDYQPHEPSLRATLASIDEWSRERKFAVTSYERSSDDSMNGCGNVGSTGDALARDGSIRSDTDRAEDAEHASVLRDTTTRPGPATSTLCSSGSQNTLVTRTRAAEAGKSRVGWVPMASEPGDVVYVLQGCKLPIVLRKVATIPDGDDDQAGDDVEAFEVIGNCYLHGAMCGEVALQEELAWKNICLV